MLPGWLDTLGTDIRIRLGLVDVMDTWVEGWMWLNGWIGMWTLELTVDVVDRWTLTDGY